MNLRYVMATLVETTRRKIGGTNKCPWNSNVNFFGKAHDYALYDYMDKNGGQLSWRAHYSTSCMGWSHTFTNNPVVAGVLQLFTWAMYCTRDWLIGFTERSRFWLPRHSLVPCTELECRSRITLSPGHVIVSFQLATCPSHDVIIAPVDGHLICIVLEHQNHNHAGHPHSTVSPIFLLPNFWISLGTLKMARPTVLPRLVSLSIPPPETPPPVLPTTHTATNNLRDAAPTPTTAKNIQYFVWTADSMSSACVVHVKRFFVFLMKRYCTVFVSSLIPSYYCNKHFVYLILDSRRESWGLQVWSVHVPFNGQSFMNCLLEGPDIILEFSTWPRDFSIHSPGQFETLAVYIPSSILLPTAHRRFRRGDNLIQK